MMLRKAEGVEELKGNDRYEGFCKDMMELIAARLGIKCNSNHPSFFFVNEEFRKVINEAIYK